MNFRNVARQLGLLLVVLGVSILIVAGLEATLLANESGLETHAVRSLGLSGLIGSVLGGLMYWIGAGTRDFLTRREALLLVAASWLIGAAVAGSPYWFWAHTAQGVPEDHAFRSAAGCYFEAMSGLTTTGATVVKNVEALPKGLLLWRALTHWFGGLGIVVLFVAVLPTLGVGGKKLFEVESPGPTAQGVRPRIIDTARVLWLIYVGMTLLETILLRIFGMSWFDAFCHSCATLATGGFGTRNASIAEYDSVPMEITIIIFMVLAGVNFGLYYHLIRGRFRAFWRDPEMKLYFTIVAVASITVCACLIEERIVSSKGVATEPSVGAAIRHGVFQTVSIQTTTGFVTADFNLWGFVPKAVLVILMFIGGCAGSTGGGIKVIRILIAFRVLLAEVERVFRPNVVRPIKVGGASVDPDLRLGSLVYVLGIIILFLVGSFLIMLFEAGNAHLAPPGSDKVMTYVTAATACAATLNNVGPGLELVGAVENYGWFRTPSLIVMSLLMVLGRLEVYAIFVLFVPRFWRQE